MRGDQYGTGGELILRSLSGSQRDAWRKDLRAGEAALEEARLTARKRD
jgi:hypothetical protein